MIRAGSETGGGGNELRNNNAFSPLCGEQGGRGLWDGGLASNGECLVGFSFPFPSPPPLLSSHSLSFE